MPSRKGGVNVWINSTHDFHPCPDGRGFIFSEGFAKFLRNIHDGEKLCGKFI
jgi:hypothetical protein